MDGPSLDDLQRWFQAVTTHPGGVGAGLHSDEARSAIDADDAQAVVAPSLQQSADERLAVYAHAYWARLVECLQEEFPVVRTAVGDDAFAGLAVDYLIAYPSRSYTLGQLGDRFADHLAATRPADDAFAAAVVELGRLERACGEVFDAAGGETLGYLTDADLAAVPAERRGDLRLVSLPTFQLLRFECDANGWFTALRASGADADPPADRTSFVALSRRDYIVRRKPLSHVQHALLSELRSGATLGRALATIAGEHPAAVHEIAASLGAWFADWAAAGFFRGVTVG